MTDQLGIHFLANVEAVDPVLKSEVAGAANGGELEAFLDPESGAAIIVRSIFLLVRI